MQKYTLRPVLNKSRMARYITRMNYLHALILGLVEGITEFLPISSTAHLVLAGKVLGLDTTSFLKSFDIIIQLGAILAVIVFYKPLSFLNGERLKRLFAAFIPTGIIGFLLYKPLKILLLGNTSIMAWSLLLGGIAMMIYEKGRLYTHASSESADITKITYTQAVGVGLFQTLALIPGVSRSAATIIGGMILGISRRTIVEFSFLLAVPVMLAATGLDLVKNISAFSLHQAGFLAMGFIAAFVVARLTIKWLLALIGRYTFTPFGIYRIILGIVVLLLA